MIGHESDLWPDRRWGIFVPPHKAGVIDAKPFKSAAERDVWVAANPQCRRSVGKRHPAVKSLRQQWRAKALSELRAWKERSR